MNGNLQLALISSSEGHPAKPSQLPDSGAAWKILAETSHSSSLLFLNAFGPAGWCGRTSPASCRIEQERLVPSSEGWGNSGMGSPTAFLTLNTSEFPSDAAVCSLSDVLETGDVPQRFYLSPRACAGILRRAEKRGKKLPAALERALTQVTERTPANRED